MKLRHFFSILACGGFLLILQGNAWAASPAVSVEVAREAIAKSSALVIDIREPSEQTNGVAPGALLIPMGQLEAKLATLLKSKAEPIILICATQNRSSKLADTLQAAGYSQTSYVQGGMNQWSSKGLPMVKPGN